MRPLFAQDDTEGPDTFSGEWWGDVLLGKPLQIVGLIVIAIVARYVVHKLIDALVTRAEDVEPPKRLLGSRHFADTVFRGAGMYDQRRAARVRTLGSLAESVVTSVILVVAVVMTLEILGYNIAPLIASAGIVGVALGFGAQNLVKDFLGGVMMLLEDQYGVGDVIDMGEVTGTVEEVGLRVTQVRGIDGTVWYVRNGEVVRVGNFGQEWARALIDIGVGYGEDTGRVRQLILEVAGELAADPEWGELILEEPEVWGVQELSDDAVLVRLVVKTKPLEQWGVSRELRERIKLRFDAEGVEFPFPQRTVWIRDERGDDADAPRPDVAPVRPPTSPATASARQPEGDVDGEG